MKKQNKKKENNKLTIVIVVVLLIVAIIVGSTYAYWSWQTATNQQTNVSVKVGGGELNITGANVTSVTMRPTNVSTKGCNPSTNTAVLKGSATVTATNYTATDMLVTLMLRGTLTSKQGTLNATNKGYLKWAIVETTSGITVTKNSCTNPGWSGTFGSVTSNTDISTGITWTAYRNSLTTAEDTALPEAAVSTDATYGKKSVTTRTYDVYVWLDSGYTFTNTGNVVSDPMQDLTLSLTWSPQSSMAQQ